MGFELRQVRAFLAVADQLHFGRAAGQLNISQPALSQQIRLLERDVGAPLFIRTSRMVELTPAGRALSEAAPLVVLEAERAQRRVDEAAEGSSGLLIIGSVNTALASITPRIMRAVRAQAPDLRLELYHMDTSAQLTALVDRRIDIGVVREAAATRVLDNEWLVSEPLVAVLPEGHPLAAAETVAPRALADEPFVLWPRMLGPDFFDRIIAYCRKHGFNPRIVAEGGDVETQLGLVAAGTGVSLQPAYYADLRRSGVAFRPLEGDAPRVALQLSWRRGDPSPAVNHFVTVARRVIADPAT
ncbi:MAG: LysR substrate-binding domain-containing protein [Actinomycetota bacterium]|nr:LysR substrate-binding domain-containing protein [Actinomycetota bacterium]